MAEEKPALKRLFVYEHDARRVELFIRFVYALCIAVVLIIYGLIAEICIVIQWFVILILGRRSEGLSNFIKGYLEYYVHVLSYCYLMTDKRPGILPKKVEIYEKEI
ncbi:DUF4389 domain-containing protein [Methanosarcinales archaeon]|nr:MAG: DUF4389 domain-containing protein [Methanosarcinales archaeon]